MGVTEQGLESLVVVLVLRNVELLEEGGHGLPTVPLRQDFSDLLCVGSFRLTGTFRMFRGRYSGLFQFDSRL